MAPIRVFAFRDGGALVDELALLRLTEREDLKDCKVVVISVAGRFREGKSLILNFMLRYLRHMSKGEEGDWLTKDDELEGFESMNSIERVTTGVLLWDEVFKMKTSTGEEVAVILMDTQGVFDTESTIQEATAIFAFSVLTSSMQVYNLMQNLKGDDLPNLELFVEYGRLATNTRDDPTAKAFQELVFLIRDWQCPHQLPFGWDGGNGLLARESISTRKPAKMGNIRTVFENIRCFLMPHPGMTVATSPDFKGNLKDVDAKFIQLTRDFIETLLAPQRFVTKRVKGEVITFGDFSHYVRRYADLLMNTDVATPKNLLEAMIEAHNDGVHVKTVEVYTKEIDQLFTTPDEFVEWSTFNDRHSLSKEMAWSFFEAASKMGGERVVRSLQHTIAKEIESRYEDLRHKNETAQLLTLLYLNEQKAEKIQSMLEDRVSRTNEDNDKLRQELNETKMETGRLRSAVNTLQDKVKETAEAAKKRCSIQ